MQVGVDRLDQLEVQLLQQLAVAVRLFQHGIEDQRLAAGAAREQVGVGAGNAVEKLAKDHGGGLRPQSSAADLKSLTQSPQNRVQGLQIESGTRITDLLVPITFRSPRKGVAAMERGLRKVGTSTTQSSFLPKFGERFAALPLYSLTVRTYSRLRLTEIVQHLGMV